jgi:hypothetical protein
LLKGSQCKTSPAFGKKTPLPILAQSRFGKKRRIIWHGFEDSGSVKARPDIFNAGHLCFIYSFAR